MSANTCPARSGCVVLWAAQSYHVSTDIVVGCVANPETLGSSAERGGRARCEYGVLTQGGPI